MFNRQRMLGAATATFPLAVDLLAAVAVTATGGLTRPTGSGATAWIAAGCVGLPLAVRRYRPGPVLVAVTTAAAAALLLGLRPEVAIYAVAFALYPVALADRRTASVGLCAALAGVLVPGIVDAIAGRLPLYGVDDPGVESFSTAPVTATGYTVLVLAGAWGLGRAVRARRAYLRQITESRTARAVAEERLRIARDVHDVVGHNLSLIAMKAAVANHVGDDRAAALRTIERASRAALDEVRSVLDTARCDGPAGADGPDSGGRPGDGGGAAPATDLDDLVGQARTANLDVTLDRPDLSTVPAGVRTSAYRIVQEALTNVRRHADASRCRVTVATGRRVLTVTVVDDGIGAGPDWPRPGRGLPGMRERAAAHGGTFSAGPEPHGGFGVRATLPFPA